ncbi:tetratricopeptide repeat protein [Myroides sp. LJL116]
MRKIITLVLIASFFSLQAQSNWNTAMQRGVDYFEKGNLTQATLVFDRLLDSNPDYEMAAYYKRLIVIMQGFRNSPVDLDALIEDNNQDIEKWLLKSTMKDEWYVLQGLNHTLDLISDPMSKGFVKSPIIIESYQDALTFNSENPRALTLLADFNFNSARFMKIDLEQNCQLIQKALLLFDQNTGNDLFLPSWGKQSAIKAQENCSTL